MSWASLQAYFRRGGPPARSQGRRASPRRLLLLRRARRPSRSRCCSAGQHDNHPCAAPQAAKAFLEHSEVGRVRTAEAPRIARAAALLFEARVAPELEALFCRGPEWEAGVSHVFALAPIPERQAGAGPATQDTHPGECEDQGSNGPEEAAGAGDGPGGTGGSGEVEAYLQDMAGVAQSSLAGAVQATCGRLRCATCFASAFMSAEKSWWTFEHACRMWGCILALRGALGLCVDVWSKLWQCEVTSLAGMYMRRTFKDGPWTHALLTRFGERAQLRNFLALPPCRALTSGRGAAAAAGAPLYAAFTASFEVGPTQARALRCVMSHPSPQCVAWQYLCHASGFARQA